jgi:crotonobetainyl-CoA:carnitine CoA-transferase CaiB-like acyl-CoA transferase
MTTAERIDRRAEVNDAVSAWTLHRSPAQAETDLIAHGIPAHAVVHSPELYADPQLAHLGHFAEIPHPHHGTVTVEASRLGLSATPSVIANGAPSFGLHTVDLLTETFGYDFDRIGELFSSGALD